MKKSDASSVSLSDVRKKDGVRLSSLDVLKCFAALFVVGIHFGSKVYDDSLLGCISQFMQVLYRIAVPLFFMITGFYYPRMVERGTLVKHIRKLLYLTIGATILYTPMIIKNISMKRLLIWLCFNEVPGPVHLWYLYAVLYVLIILYFAERYLSRRIIYVLAGVCYLLGISVEVVGLHSLLYRTPLYRNFLFMAFPFVMAGCFLAEYVGREVFSKRTNLFWMAAALLSFLLCFVEKWMVGRFLEAYLFSLPLVLSIFVLALRHPRFGEGSWIALIGCKYSAYIYILHLGVSRIIIRIIDFEKGYVEVILRPLVCFIATLCVSWLAVKAVNYITRRIWSVEVL